MKARSLQIVEISGHRYFTKILLSNLFCTSLSFCVNISALRWVLKNHNHDNLNFNDCDAFKILFFTTCFPCKLSEGENYYFFKSNFCGCTLQVTVNYRINILLSRWSSYTKPKSYFITLVKVTFLWSPKEWKRLNLLYKTVIIMELHVFIEKYHCGYHDVALSSLCALIHLKFTETILIISGALVLHVCNAKYIY